MSIDSVTIPTSELGYGYDILISHWREGLTAYRQYLTGHRERIEGGIGVGLNFIAGDQSIEEWLEDKPGFLLANTAPFPEYQYQMLWLAVNSMNAEQILASRPLLLAMICERFTTDNHQALRLAELGQREILKQLGLASTKAALKFIDKLDLRYERNCELDLVMAMLDAKTCHFQKFRHYPLVNYASLSLDNIHPFLTGTKLGQNLAKASNNAHYRLSRLIEDTMNTGLALGVDAPMQNIVRLESHEALVELHDEWVRRRIAQRIESSKPDDADTPYPLHLLGNDHIEPITDYYELSKEGEEMNHCIGVYHQRIAQGKYAAFRLMSPERMTIGIAINPKKQFPYDIDQISGPRNALPSEEARKQVYAWLDAEKQRYLSLSTASSSDMDARNRKAV